MYEKLRAAARKVTENIDRYAYLRKSKSPIRMEFVWNTAAMAEICMFVVGAERVEDRVTAYECDDYIAAFKMFTVFRRLAYSVSNPDYL